jgi:hypothetical protein
MDTPAAAPTPESAEEPRKDEAAPKGAPVDIHPLHGPVHSIRDFLFQLMTITAGVLIALSLEGLVAWRDHQTLVREARDTISREIADNRKKVEAELAQADAWTKSLDHALDAADQVLSGKKLEGRINFAFSLAELSAAGWQGAERTGAFGYMEYAEVQDHSSVYRIQELYAAQQRRLLDRVAAALASVGGGADRASLKDWETFRQEVVALRAELLIQEQIGRQLLEKYRQVLDG